MILVVAGNYSEYLNYLQETGHTLADTVYLSDPKQLYGFGLAELVKVGHWYNHPIAKEKDFKQFVKKQNPK